MIQLVIGEMSTPCLQIIVHLYFTSLIVSAWKVASVMFKIHNHLLQSLCILGTAYGFAPRTHCMLILSVHISVSEYASISLFVLLLIMEITHFKKFA